MAPAITAAPPSAWTQRALTSAAIEGASAQASDAALNATRPSAQVRPGAR